MIHNAPVTVSAHMSRTFTDQPLPVNFDDHDVDVNTDKERLTAPSSPLPSLTTSTHSRQNSTETTPQWTHEETTDTATPSGSDGAPSSQSFTSNLPQQPERLGCPSPSPRAHPTANANLTRSPDSTPVESPSLFSTISRLRERSMSPTIEAPYRQPTEEPEDGSPPPPTTSASPQSDGLGRKASSGFGALITRMGSIRKTARPPAAVPAAGRRNTPLSATSIRRRNSLATIEDGGEADHGTKHRRRPTLRDQFQTLRKQGEHGACPTRNSDGLGEGRRREIPRPGSSAMSIEAADETLTSPRPEPDELEDARSVAESKSAMSPRLRSQLPPGTASGLTAGPATEPHPVDWDLWQNVVYEGPSAVARSSGADLNRAIASGIPAAIRGVVWQVLADSQSDDLENMYRTLKARGTGDAEAQPTPVLEDSPRVGPVSVANGSQSHGEESLPPSALTPSGQTEESKQLGAIPSPANHDDEAGPRNKLLAEKQKREAAAISKLEKAIRRDLGSRTSYSKYTQSAGLQDGLFGVCKAYALFDEEVGYAQGINFIAMPLLFNATEEEAFTLLVTLMHKYDLRSLFIPDMPGLHLRLYQFERLLEDFEPRLSCHFRRKHVDPKLYATQWFLTLFAYRFPLQLVLRVYDLVLSEGLAAILKFGIALMQKNCAALLEMKEMGQLTGFLKDKLFDAYTDKSPTASKLLDSGFFGSVTGGADKELYRADELVRDASEVSISEATLEEYSREWEAISKHEQEQAAQLGNLRASNVALAARVKELEERTQAQDDEQVRITADIVTCKVENERLADENEGLKMKTEELQRVVDAQPAEVEENLKVEMDRIMQRNIEIQNENRNLKEEMDDMEQELVNTKMQLAQV